MRFTLRRLTPDDLPSVLALQAGAYGALCESAVAMGSRLEQGGNWCLGAEDDHGRLGAYLLAHPWTGSAPPAWNQPLAGLPALASRFYLHDLALGAATRGQGLAGRLVQQALAGARRARCHEALLVAVQDSTGFWSRQGFRVLTPPPAVAAKLASYGDDARLMWQRL